MAVKCYNILGTAYCDTLKKTTGKPLSALSEELGYSPTYLKNIGISGRIRIGVADLIEAKYWISVAPYIIPEGYIIRNDGTGETIVKEDPAPDRVDPAKVEELASIISKIVYDAIVRSFPQEVDA